MRLAFLPIVLMAPLAAAASTPVQPVVEPSDITLQRARAEAQAADAQVRALQQAASKALGTAARLRARQLAAAQAIDAAEARISVADSEMRLVTAQQALLRARLEREQQPVSSLLAGLAMMARRPPLLALADNSSTDELVRVRVLLDSTLPAIRARTAGLSQQIAQGAKLQQAAVAARAKLQASRSELDKRRSEFAALERQALQSAAASSGQAVSAGDELLAAGETVEALASAADQARSVSGLVAALAASPEPPPAPLGRRPPQSPGINYTLPADAPVITGLGAVSSSGVRSRGIALQTRRGTPVRAPADGTIRFAGPFRDYDGVLIIDHGRGWMSLLVNVSAQGKVGDFVRMGEPLGRALGPLEVQISNHGRHISPALIAGSSASLSKGGKRS
ncbi:MAG: peptidoglycan DD-metalloendopeptidase family protein [Sphingomicrobium sp.]